MLAAQSPILPKASTAVIDGCWSRNFQFPLALRIFLVPLILPLADLPFISSFRQIPP